MARGVCEQEEGRHRPSCVSHGKRLTGMYKISWPNRITLTRIILVVPFVMVMMHLQDPAWSGWARWAALIIFAVMAVTDGLDGYLARKLNAESAAGKILDPLADKILIFFSVILLAHRGTHVEGALLPVEVAIIAIGKDLVVVLGFCVIYFSTSQVYIDPRKVGKRCTLVQLLMVIAILLSPDLPEFMKRLPALLWWIASILAVATVIRYFQLGHRFVIHHESKDNG